MVRQVSSLKEFNDILKEAGDRLVVVDFTAQWCGPCQMIGPIFIDLSQRPENKDVIFLKVDVDEASDVSSHCTIRCMPTFQFYKRGEMVNEFSGADKTKLENELANLR